MALGDSDLGVFFTDFADTVSFGAQTVKGNIDAPSKDAMFDRASVSDIEYSLKVSAVTFNPWPVVKSTLTVMTGRYAGNYNVREVNPLDDGAIVELKLRRIS